MSHVTYEGVMSHTHESCHTGAIHVVLRQSPSVHLSFRRLFVGQRVAHTPASCSAQVQCVAACVAACCRVCCSVLQCVAVLCLLGNEWRMPLQVAVIGCRVLQHMLPCVAVCCSICCRVLQYVAVCCNVLLCVITYDLKSSLFFSLSHTHIHTHALCNSFSLTDTATHCNTLQHTATHSL